MHGKICAIYAAYALVRTRLKKLYAFPLYFLNWMHLANLSHFDKEKRSPGWVKAAVHVEAGPGAQSGLT